MSAEPSLPFLPLPAQNLPCPSKIPEPLPVDGYHATDCLSRGCALWSWEGPLGTPLGMAQWKRAGSSPWSRKELDMTEELTLTYLATLTLFPHLEHSINTAFLNLELQALFLLCEPKQMKNTFSD